jgi:hypothetical protein
MMAGERMAYGPVKDEMVSVLQQKKIFESDWLDKIQLTLLMEKQMKIIINDTKLISAIQHEFNAMFPFLKIEFLTRSSYTINGTEIKYIKHSEQTLAECRTKLTEGSIRIIPSMTVSDLEKEFRKVYGLSVQVFRKSGKVWLESTITDVWTLEEQNKEGEELSAKRAG